MSRIILVALLLNISLVWCASDPRCPAVGKVPIYSSTKKGCKWFANCDYDPTKNEITYKESECAKPGFAFDPRLLACVANYRCPEYLCQGEPDLGFKFVDVNNVGGSTYIECRVDSSGYYYPVFGFCQTGLVFKQYYHTILIDYEPRSIRKCLNNYNKAQ